MWRLVRNWHKIEDDSLRVALNETAHRETQSGDQDLVYGELTHRLRAAINVVAPARRERIMDRTKGAPWYTAELRSEKQALRQCERHWRISYAPLYRENYKTKFDLYKASLIATKSAYYDLRVREPTDTQKETFNVLGELSKKKELRSVVNQVDCDKIQDFFLTKVGDIIGEIGTTCISQCPFPVLDPDYQGSIRSVFPALDFNGLAYIMAKVKSGSPEDPCTPRVFKMGLPVVGPEILPLLNLSPTGKVPHKFKEGMVISLLKKKKKKQGRTLRIFLKNSTDLQTSIPGHGA